MKDWYTKQEVADLLNVSTNTVYYYAKQGKIVKVNDPHRNYREARYQKAEVDALIEERNKQKVTGMRPSEIARQMNVSVQRIYQIIKENNLPVNKVQIGDEVKGYSISEELAKQIRDIAEETLPTRGTRTEFFDSERDIALFQRFLSNGKEIRVVRNEDWEWGFNLHSSWLPYDVASKDYRYTAAYKIHQKNLPLRGYTDFRLPKHMQESYEFLDVVYQVWGIENIRIRERPADIELSIKSGSVDVKVHIPDTLTNEVLASFLISGGIDRTDTIWTLISGYRKVSLDLPAKLIKQLQMACKDEGMTLSEYVQSRLEESFEKD